uniref:Uncharacterized protein n=1 Tax=Rhizophora mucronata TaxID=61149 RepID=A0A2P2PW47_RHIMU
MIIMDMSMNTLLSIFSEIRL